MNRTLATSLTTATFLIIAISGVMMFFHFFDSNVKSLHEFLGLAFIAAVLFHLFYNWKSMKSYFNKKMFFASLAAGAIATVVFVVTSMNQPQDPKRTMIMSLLNAPVEQAYSVLKIENADDKLNKLGIKVTEEKTIMQIAKANGKHPFELVGMLLEK